KRRAKVASLPLRKKQLRVSSNLRRSGRRRHRVAKQRRESLRKKLPDHANALLRNVARRNPVEDRHLRAAKREDAAAKKRKESGQGWIRTSEGVKPADLQSAPFGHFGTYPPRVAALIS